MTNYCFQKRTNLLKPKLGQQFKRINNKCASTTITFVNIRALGNSPEKILQQIVHFPVLKQISLLEDACGKWKYRSTLS